MPAPRDPSPDASELDRLVHEQTVDATRRTHLASERTYLAWWRTGLTSLTVGIGAGRLVPALTSGATWPYTIAGAGYALLGVLCIGYAAHRRREIERALERGGFVAPDDRVIAVMTLLGASLGLLVLVIVLVRA
jgi:putative membrane protein